MYRIIKPSDELYHYGVKGMKWGVRRYQNYDGTRIGTGGAPTINANKQAGKRLAGGRNTIAGGQGGKAKGTARLAAKVPKMGLAASMANGGSNSNVTEETSEKKEEKKKGLFDKSIKQGKGREDISPAEQINKSFKSGTESAKKITEVGSKYDPKVKKAGDAAEKEAKNMSDKELRDKINRIKMEREYRSLAESDVESGWTKAGEILEVVGDVASITLAVLGIVATIKGLKHDGLDSSEDEAKLNSLLTLGGYDDEFIAHAIDLDADYIEDYLEHHGIKGMKWGVRRYQNYDGTRIGVGSGSGGGGGGSSKPRSIAGGGGPRLAAKAKTSKTAEIKKGLKAKYAEQRELGKAVKDAVTRPIDERRANAQAAHKEAADAIKNGLNKIVKDGRVEATASDQKPYRKRYEEARAASKELDDLGESIGRDMYEKQLKANSDFFKNNERAKNKAREEYRWLGHEEAMKRRPDLVKKEIEFLNKFDNDDLETFDYNEEEFNYYLDLWMKYN